MNSKEHGVLTLLWNKGTSETCSNKRACIGSSVSYVYTRTEVDSGCLTIISETRPRSSQPVASSQTYLLKVAKIPLYLCLLSYSLQGITIKIAK